MSDRLAILIGNGRFDRDGSLPELLGPKTDLAAFGSLLSDPDVGNFVVFELLDRDRGHLQPELERAFDMGHAGATVIFYYAGHVLADPGRGLFLAAADTDLADLKGTALPLSWIKSQLRACRSRNLVVILDCCYLGASGRVDQVDIEQQLRRIRTDVAPDVHVIASPASNHSQESRELTTEAGFAGRLTHCMVEGLATGAADRDGGSRTGVRDLNEYLGARLGEARPLWSGPLEGADPEIVANPHPIEGVDLDAFRPPEEDRPRTRRRLGAAAATVLSVAFVAAGFLLTDGDGAPRATRVDEYFAGHGLPERVGLIDDLDRLRSVINRTGWVEHVEPLDGSGPRYPGAVTLSIAGAGETDGRLSLGLRQTVEMGFGAGVHGFGVICSADLNAAEVDVELVDGLRYRFDVRIEAREQEFFGFVSRQAIARVRITAASVRFAGERMYVYAEEEFQPAAAGLR